MFFFKGCILGICIAAPVGPIGVLCIKRTLRSGRWSGFFSGLGAAFADGLFGGIAAFSLTTISSLLISMQPYLKLVGGLFLCYLGLKTFLEKPAILNALTHKKALWRDFSSTFALTLTNPMTILSFMGIFAGLGLTLGSYRYAEASSLVAGVFVGSLIWWMLLAEGVTFFRHRVNEKIMKRINQITGIMILGFGLYSIASV
jgi:threonine/homoserine/homoserine lactone efflux protein